MNENARTPEPRERGLLVITRTRSNYTLRMRVPRNTHPSAKLPFNSAVVLRSKTIGPRRNVSFYQYPFFKGKRGKRARFARPVESCRTDATIAIARDSPYRVVSDAICSESRLVTSWECPAPCTTQPPADIRQPACRCNFNGGRIASQLREDKPPTLDPATSPEPAVCIRARAFIPVYKTRAPRASTRPLCLPSALVLDAAADGVGGEGPTLTRMILNR